MSPHKTYALHDGQDPPRGSRDDVDADAVEDERKCFARQAKCASEVQFGAGHSAVSSGFCG